MKPLPRPKKDEMPFALDATDIDVLVKAAGSNARIRIVTRRYEYDSADDLVKNASFATKLVELGIDFDGDDQLEIVPRLHARGPRSEKLLPDVQNVLENKRRAIWPGVSWRAL
jgi:hypothetical protein